MEFLPVIVTSLLLFVLGIAMGGRAMRVLRLGKRQSLDVGRRQGYSVPVTIVILAQDQEQDLRNNLTDILSQDYCTEYYVSVVDIHSSDGTLSFLESMEERYHNLSHSSIPASARDISLQRLAITLGMRSAFTDWVIVAEAGCRPRSSHWLSAFMGQCTEEKDGVLGFAIRQGAGSGWQSYRSSYFRLWQQLLWLPFAISSVPPRADDCFFAYRRDRFLSHGGFASDANLLCGTASLLFNRNVLPGRCGASLSIEATLDGRDLTSHAWYRDRVYFMETLHQSRHVFLYRSLYFLHAALPWLLAFCSAWLLSSVPNPWGIVAGVLILLLPMMVYSFTHFAACRYYGIRQLLMLCPVFHLMIPFWDLSAWLGWRFAKKNTFRKKFI